MAKQKLVKILDPDEIITTIAPHVQYSPTEPGAPLSDKECNELNVSIYGGVLGEAITVINRILSKRNVRKCGCGYPPHVGRCQPDNSERNESPVPIDEDLIGKALTAYNTHKFTEITTAYEKMAAAARVIADELLGPVADDEWISPDDGKTVQATRYGVNQILAKRRARIGAKTKTPEERVKIEEVATHATDGSCYWEKRLYCDGNEMKQIDVLNYAYQGLIEKLKKEEADRTRVESR